MVNELAITFHTVNAVILLGLLIYAVKMHSIFKGGKIGSSIPYLIGAAAFLLFGSLTAIAVVSGFLPTDYNFMPSAIRTIGFAFLFMFALGYVKDWKGIS